MSYQASFREFERDLSDLTNGQREVYEAIEQDGYGVREYARRTGRAPGTVGNLLRRARDRVEVDDAS